MTLILKAQMYRSPVWFVSGGLAFGIPTARGTHTQVVDFLGDIHDFDAEARRVRDFFDGKYLHEPPPRQMETIGDLADALDKIRGAVPADDRAFPTSDQVDEVVYGVSRHVTAK